MKFGILEENGLFIPRRYKHKHDIWMEFGNPRLEYKTLEEAQHFLDSMENWINFEKMPINFNPSKNKS